MPIAPELRTNIYRNLFLRPDLKQKIIDGWDTLSTEQKNSLLTMLLMGHEVQDHLIAYCTTNNTQFAQGFENYADTRTTHALREIEAEDRKEEEQALATLQSDITK